MALYFSMAQVALLGGSFAPLGGQNLIEAAACGCPVIMGPHTFNFEQAAEMADQAGVALRVVDMTLALQKAYQLLHEPSALVSRSELARAFAKAHEGATERTAQAVIQTMC
jgi:3-deoxy-D-manno-octulosonic-acid transferase